MRAVGRIVWHVFKDEQVTRLRWWGLQAVLVFCAYMAGNAFLPMFLPMFAIVPHFYICSLGLSGRALHALPVEQRDLGTSVWVLGVLWPLLVVTPVTTLGAYTSLYAKLEGHSVLECALLSWSYFLMPIGTVAAGAGLRGTLWSGAVAAGHPRLRMAGIGALIAGELALLGGWVYMGLPTRIFEKSQFTAPALAVGAAGVLISFLFRKHLVFRGPAAGMSIGTSTRGTAASSPAETPRFESWMHAMAEQLSIPVFIGGWLAYMTIPGFFDLLTKDKMGGPVLAVGVIAAGTLACLCAGWINWRASMRAWRMLPLDRMQLSRKIVAFSAIPGVVPWLVVFAWSGRSHIARGTVTFDVFLFYLGVALCTQGLLLVILPLSLLRFEDSAATGLLKLLTVVGALGAVIGLPFLMESRNLAHANPASNGGLWLAAGAVAVCVGGVLSVWHTSRVLRHDGCYGKATE